MSHPEAGNAIPGNPAPGSVIPGNPVTTGNVDSGAQPVRSIEPVGASQARQERSRLRAYSRLLDLPVQRRLISLLDGRHYGRRAGSSQEFLDLAEYQVGDEIKSIDWKTTARYGKPVVKRFESTAQLRVMLAVDGSAKMGALARGEIQDTQASQAHPHPLARKGLAKWLEKIAGKRQESLDLPLETKSRVQLHLATAISFLTLEHGDQLGLALGGDGEVRALPARAGMGHAESLLRLVERVDETGPTQNLAAVLRHVDVSARSRSLVVVITDAAGIDEAAHKHLRRLTMRHEVIAFIIPDFDPTRVPPGYAIDDVEVGLLPDFVRSDPDLAKQLDRMRREQEQQVGELLHQLGVKWALVPACSAVLDALVEVLQGGATCTCVTH